MRISSVFSFYGGKSKIVSHYPEAYYDWVIEPFGGAAAYSWRHRFNNVWINDLDSRVASIWEFLLSPDAANWIKQLPQFTAGEKVSQVLEGFPDGLIELARAEANQGTQGAKGVHDQVTSMGEKCMPRMIPKLLEILPDIAHWKFTSRPYQQLFNLGATWFIDPPYANVAGSRYRESDIDYEELSQWCRSRAGQVIVCENKGADWLPFVPFDHRRVSIRSRYQLADAKEVMWTRGDE